MREQMSGGLGEVAAWAEVQDRVRALASPGGSPPEQQRGLAGLDRRRVEPHLRARRVMRGEHARRERRAASRRAAPTSVAPSTASIASRGTPPGRSRRGVPPRQATMVDSTPTCVGAAIEHRVDAAVEIGEHMGGASVGLTRPERLAEGAATGRPTRSRSACASGWAGTRRRDAVEPGAGEIGDRAARRRRHDEGQRTRPEAPRASASALVVERRPAPRAASRLGTWAISGLKRGRSLAA